MSNDLSILSTGGQIPVTVFEDDLIRISGIRGGSQALFVAFTGIGHRLGALQREEFVKISQSDGANSVLFVQDKTRSWYNEPSFLTKLQPVVAEWALGSQRIVTLGNSMGGFGAIVFAGMLKADTAIAFSPQFSVASHIVPKDRRWHKFRSKITEFRYESAAPYIVDECRYYLFQGDGSADWYQIGGFPIRPNVLQFVVPGGPHNLASLLRANGALAPIVEASAAGDLEALSEILITRNGAVLRSASNDIYSGREGPRAIDDTTDKSFDQSQRIYLRESASRIIPETQEDAPRQNNLRRFHRRREARKSERVLRIKAEREAEQKKILARRSTERAEKLKLVEDDRRRAHFERIARGRQLESERLARKEAKRVARVQKRRAEAIAKGEAIKVERAEQLKQIEINRRAEVEARRLSRIAERRKAAIANGKAHNEGQRKLRRPQQGWFGKLRRRIGLLFSGAKCAQRNVQRNVPKANAHGEHQ